MTGHKKFCLVVMFLISGNAFAVLPEAAEVTSSESTWTTVSRTVKVTVSKWFSTFSGPEKVKATGTAAPTQIAKIPVPAAHTAATAPVAQVPQQVAQPPAPVESVESRELRTQPLFAQKYSGSSLEDLQVARASLKAKDLLGVKKAGRAGASRLPKLKTGVPIADIKKMRASRKLSRLDIGRESLLSKEDFALPSFKWSLQKANVLKSLPKVPAMSESEFRKVAMQPWTPSKGPRGLQANFRAVGKAISLEQVQAVQIKTAETQKPVLKPYAPLSDEEIKMVSALILFERGDHCHMIMGLFEQLSKVQKTKFEALYHLGACGDQLSMQQSAFDSLAQVIKSEDKEFAPMALEILAKDLPTVYEKDFYNLLKGLKNMKSLLSEKSSDDVFYRFAKGANKSGDYKTSLTMAGMVQTNFKDEAEYLSGINYLALKDKKNAVRKLQELWTSMEARGITDSNIRAVTATNLARLYFAQKEYPKALEYYNKVPKDHGYWVQALIEQGWTQLALNDSAGAIGNMYSLHSPYFKSVYQPESFVVRTIGYINICQYGDAYKTLSVLEADYRNWYTQTNNYLSTQKEPTQLYHTVKTYLKGKSTEAVDGVPSQVLREMARRKEFINLQVALNDKQDESGRYEGVNEKIKKEKASIRWRAEQAKKRFDNIKAQIATATKKKETKDLNELNAGLRREKDLTIAYRYQLALLEISRQGYLAFQSTAQNKLVVVQGMLTGDVSRALNVRAKTMQLEMAKVLENNEFLRYEVFSGSGENIRYQVAGGQVDGTNNRIPANIKPTKMMNWNFDGEFWEDEIGSYRSALHNNCPTNGHQALLEKEEE